MPKLPWVALAWTTAGAIALFAALLLLVWWQQERLLFYPAPLPQSYRLASEPQVHESAVEVEGARLSVLHLKLPAPRGVVLFLHGNGGNLAGWFTGSEFYRAANFDVVMPDYRGYGKSTGRISSPGQLREDVRAVWRSVASQYEGKRVVLYGRSLGSGLAADLAAELTAAGQPPALTVLVSPYTSMRDLATELHPWVPGALVRYPLDTTRHLPSIGGPVLLLHGEDDALIGVHHARRLHALRPSAQLAVVPGAGHNDIHLHPAYRSVLSQALARL
ncbi:MAG TPA: alpha/beta fold hydrolase [Ramlibacter sp.]|nr:alpha/beta fold hydrolase [Ramlibacter sp.]